VAIALRVLIVRSGQQMGQADCCPEQAALLEQCWGDLYTFDRDQITGTWVATPIGGGIALTGPCPALLGDALAADQLVRYLRDSA
jgi:hypothetical protein